MLQRTSTLTLATQLADRLAERIALKQLLPGARLPSVRQCAAQHGVSPATVVSAYDALVGRGLARSEPQRGFYVRENQTNTSFVQHPRHLFATNSVAKSINRSTSNPRTTDGEVFGQTSSSHAPISAAALIRGMFHSRNNLTGSQPQPSMGVLPREWMHNDFLPAALRQVASNASLADMSLQYGDPAGDAHLRHTLAQHLSAVHIDVLPQHIVTSVGATQALDIASRTLLRAGDHVMVEEPGWAVEFARLEALGMRILPVPRGPDGPDLAVMQRYCETHSPKLYVSVSVLHNPTGHMLSPASAHRILQLAKAHSFYVLEDDTYTHLAGTDATRMSALDGLERTIYVSGFAKILAPNWRVGFMAAPAHLAERMQDTKMLTSLTTPALLERAMAICIEKGQLHRHAERVRDKLAAARNRAAQLAIGAGCTFAAKPQGLFGWVDTGVDTDALSQRMLDHGYLLAPGSLFHAVRKPSTLMRINFATTQNAEFWKVFEKVRR